MRVPGTGTIVSFMGLFLGISFERCGGCFLAGVLRVLLESLAISEESGEGDLGEQWSG